MPFQSKAQSRYLHAVKPAIAKRFASKTLGLRDLPERVQRKKRQLIKPRIS